MIKTTLKQLVGYFAASAEDENLPLPIRRFAAQLTILTAHLERVESRAKAEDSKLEASIAELTQLVAVLASKANGGEQPGQQPQPTQDQSTDEPEAAQNEEEDAEAMAERVMQETEAEVAAAANAAPAAAEKPSALVPMRKPNGGKKTAEEVS